MKTYFTAFAIFWVLFPFANNMLAQENSQSKKALIEGIITDFNKKIKVGEVIVFENTKTKEAVEVISDDQGKFSAGLPYSQNYLIKIKGFNEEQDYTEFSIPALELNQTSLFFNIDIMIELPTTFTLNNVYFDTGKASLKQESYTELNKLLEFMKTHKLTVIEIAGHTDNVGEDADNLILSQQRADAVRNFLITHGIETKRVTAKGYGEKQPVATNDTDEGRQTNRRTEVRIISD